MKDSELRMIETMLKKQDELNSAIMKEYGLTTISKEQIDLATLDEIGEFTHELKGDWCWWKFTQEPVDVAKVFEEYVDVLHFALMFEITYGDCRYQNEDIEYNYKTLKFDSELGQAYVYSRVLGSVEDDDVLAYVIALGLHMGFSLEKIYKEYIRKNEINKERLANGY